MSLTCSNYSDSDGDWYYEQQEDYITLNTKRSRKCCSCRGRIAVGELALPFIRFRYSETGTEIYMATRYMCEKCGDIAMNLSALGYCTVPGEDDMRELLKEYAAMVEKERGLKGDKR